jgi:hypothetical protein
MEGKRIPSDSIPGGRRLIRGASASPQIVPGGEVRGPMLKAGASER